MDLAPVKGDVSAITDKRVVHPQQTLVRCSPSGVAAKAGLDITKGTSKPAIPVICAPFSFCSCTGLACECCTLLCCAALTLVIRADSRGRPGLVRTAGEHELAVKAITKSP